MDYYHDGSGFHKWKHDGLLTPHINTEEQLCPSETHVWSPSERSPRVKPIWNPCVKPMNPAHIFFPITSHPSWKKPTYEAHIWSPHINTPILSDNIPWKKPTLSDQIHTSYQHENKHYSDTSYHYQPKKYNTNPCINMNITQPKMPIWDQPLQSLLDRDIYYQPKKDLLSDQNKSGSVYYLNTRSLRIVPTELLVTHHDKEYLSQPDWAQPTLIKNISATKNILKQRCPSAFMIKNLVVTHQRSYV